MQDVADVAVEAVAEGGIVREDIAAIAVGDSAAGDGVVAADMGGDYGEGATARANAGEAADGVVACEEDDGGATATDDGVGEIGGFVGFAPRRKVAWYASSMESQSC
jgi:hypothetical protein